MTKKAQKPQPGPVDASRPDVSSAISFLESSGQQNGDGGGAGQSQEGDKNPGIKGVKPGTSLVDLFRKSVGEDGNIISGPDGAGDAGNDDATGGTVADGKKKESPVAGEKAQIPGVEQVEYENLPVSKVIKEKFGRFKKNEEALMAEIARRDTELAELRKKAEAVREPEPIDVRKTKEYQEIEARLAAHEETVQKIAIEKSTAFIARYDKPITERFSKIGSLLSGVKSDDAKRSIASIVQSAASIPVAMESEADFYSKVAEIDGIEDVPGVIKARITAQLEQVREIAQGREQALADWRKSADEIRSAESAQRAELPGMAVKVFDKILSLKEQEEAESFAAFRKFEQFKFDDTVSAPLKAARGEIEKSSATGVVTPELMKFAVDGAHASFYKTQFIAFRDALKKTFEELQALKEKSRRMDEADPSRSRQSRTAPKQDDDPKNYPRGSGLLENLRKVRSGELVLP